MAFWSPYSCSPGSREQVAAHTRIKTTRRINNSIVYVPETPLEAQQEPFVLNTSTHKFHRPTCSEIKKIHTENRQDVGGNTESDIPLATPGGSLAPARVFYRSPPQKVVCRKSRSSLSSVAISIHEQLIIAHLERERQSSSATGRRTCSVTSRIFAGIAVHRSLHARCLQGRVRVIEFKNLSTFVFGLSAASVQCYTQRRRSCVVCRRPWDSAS